MLKTAFKTLFIAVLAGLTYLAFTWQYNEDIVLKKMQDAQHFVTKNYNKIVANKDKAKQEPAPPASAAANGDSESPSTSEEPPQAFNEPEPVPPPAFMKKQKKVDLPPLQSSDKIVKDTLSKLLRIKGLERHLKLDAIIYRFVLTVDNLTARTLSVKERLMQSPPGIFMVKRDKNSDRITISRENYRRYTRYIQIIESVDKKKLVLLYQKYYPLFQSAYESLGYSGLQFHDRLLEVLDHLIQTPVPPQEITLTQPSVFYKYTDSQLEQASAGRKILYRMGLVNAARLKDSLSELKYQLSRAN